MLKIPPHQNFLDPPLFDTVSHNILFQKLYRYGIRGTAYKLLESYLSFRNQFVSVQNHHYSLKPINMGFPQESMLGLLLFLICVNDIPNAVSCSPRLFADDTCLLVSSPSPTVLENECNKEMHKLQTWISANELQINPEKSAIIVISSKLTAQTTNLSIFYNERPINCCDLKVRVGCQDRLCVNSDANETIAKWESRYVRKCYLTVVKKVLVPYLLCYF